MNNLPSRFASLLPKIRAGLVSALGRFPWMLLCGLAGTVAAIVSVEGAEHEINHEVTGPCLKVLMTAALGMPLFFSLRMLRERSGRLARLPVEIAGLPLLAAWFFTLPRWVFDGPWIVGIRWLLLLAGLHAFAAVSAFARGTAGNGFWQFNRRIFLRFFLATLFAGVLTAGLELALFSADKLFGLHLGKSYANLFFIMAGCFHPFFFLAGVPRDFAALELDADYPRGLKAFTQFVLAPLAAVYTIILYAYALKIVAARTWPHGWVALPVLILSGVGILAALLLHPLRARIEEKWARWFCRNFPRALAPLSLLLLLSVRERIAAYGVTEQRYLGIVAGGWILAWALVFIFKKSAGIRWVPASLAAICLLAAFGPWSAGAISKGSQLRRLAHLLEAHGLLAEGKIHVPDKNAKLPSNDYYDLGTTIQYLAETHGTAALHGLFGELFNEMEWKNLSSSLASVDILRKLKLLSGSIGANTQAYFCLDGGGATVEGYKKVSLFENVCGSSWQLGKRKGGDLFFGIEDGKLKVADDKDAKPEPAPLDEFFKSLQGKTRNALPVEQMTVDWTFHGRALRIIFANLSFNPGDPDRIQTCSFLLIEK